MPTRVVIVLLLSAAIALASLTGAGAASGIQGPPNVLVTQRLVVGGAVPIEGSVGYVRIRNRAGKQVGEGDFGQVSELLFSLGPGWYRLVSYQRLCGGNCGSLGAPADVCSKRFRVVAGRHVSAAIRVTPGSGCRIRIRYG